MRNIATKVDGSTTLPADTFNSYIAELENTATQTGQTLDPDAGPDTDLAMIGKAMSVYGSGGGDFYTDSGAVNAYVLSKVGSVVSNPSYFNGMRCIFKVGTTNTGASTVNISGLGVISITIQGGTALSGGELISGQLVELIYSTTGSRFELVILSSNRNKTTIFTSSGTWTKPAGLNFIKVTVVGGGGGAGGVAGAGAGTIGASGGGGAGGHSEKTILAASLSASETVTIGGGGSGGSGAADGSDGGTTSFGSHCQSTGGLGGGLDGATAVNDVAPGGGGGVGSGGDIISDGGPGSPGITVSAVQGIGGNGGNSMVGGGGLGKVADGSGNDAVSFGSGGGGARNEGTTTDRTGGDGRIGIIIIEEFF